MGGPKSAAVDARNANEALVEITESGARITSAGARVLLGILASREPHNAQEKVFLDRVVFLRALGLGCLSNFVPFRISSSGAAPDEQGNVVISALFGDASPARKDGSVSSLEGPRQGDRGEDAFMGGVLVSKHALERIGRGESRAF